MSFCICCGPLTVLHFEMYTEAKGVSISRKNHIHKPSLEIDIIREPVMKNSIEFIADRNALNKKYILQSDLDQLQETEKNGRK